MVDGTSRLSQRWTGNWRRKSSAMVSPCFVPQFLEGHKSTRDVPQMGARGRTEIRELLAARSATRNLHFSIVKSACQRTTLTWLFPVFGGVHGQEMKQRVIRRRNRSSQTRLPGPRLIDPGQNLRLIEQLLSKPHSSFFNSRRDLRTEPSPTDCEN